MDPRLGHGQLDRDVERGGLTDDDHDRTQHDRDHGLVIAERDLHWSPVKFGEITARP